MYNTPMVKITLPYQNEDFKMNEKTENETTVVVVKIDKAINGHKVNESTKIRYVPNPKKPSGKSYARYAVYEKATTIAEYFELAEAKFGMADLKYDESKGFLQILNDKGEVINPKEAVVKTKRKTKKKEPEEPEEIDEELDEELDDDLEEIYENLEEEPAEDVMLTEDYEDFEEADF